jgi:hypothetical protein
MVKSNSKVWMRMGDNDDYHDFDSMFDAGTELGRYLDASSSLEGPFMSYIYSRGEGPNGTTGINAPGFQKNNYISLFWGDNDAQITKGHTQADLAEFKRGVREGADIPVLREKRITHGISIRKVPAKKSGPSGFGGVR